MAKIDHFVVIQEVPKDSVIGTLRLIREVTGLSLSDAKALISDLPMQFAVESLSEAKRIAWALMAEGADARIEEGAISIEKPKAPEPPTDEPPAVPPTAPAPPAHRRVHRKKHAPPPAPEPEPPAEIPEPEPEAPAVEPQSQPPGTAARAGARPHYDARVFRFGLPWRHGVGGKRA